MTIGPYTLSGSGYDSIFLAKYDLAGGVAWAKTAIGVDTGWATVEDVELGADDNFYITWSFRESLDFDGHVLTGIGRTDIFVMELDKDGNPLQSVVFGGADHNDIGVDLARGSDGKLYLAGRFGSDAIAFGDTTLINTGYTDYFIVRLTPSFEVDWAINGAGEKSETFYSMTLGSDNDLYIFGDFLTDSIIIGPDEITNAGTFDIFWAKYSTAGEALWGRGTGGIDWEWSNEIVADSKNNLYLIGTYGSDSVSFGDITLSQHHPSTWSNDMFVAKYDSSGNAIWAIDSLQQASEASGQGVAIDGADNIIAVGSYNIEITFGDFALVSQGVSDGYCVKLNADGIPLWAIAVGGDAMEMALGVQSGPEGHIYINGRFSDGVSTIGDSVLEPLGRRTLFLAKLRENDCPE